jgi:membrane associated rhomboid family serine protease
LVIPIYDNDPLEKSHRAYVTFVLIALNIAIYAVQAAASDTTATAILLNFALFPVAVMGDAVTGGFVPPSFSLVTYMFLHGGWMHVLLNMLFLWVFADNIEDALGHGRFLVFYLLCGIAGGVAHMLAAPASNVPLVGASGAIAGVIAAYLMIRPCAKITVLLFGFVPIRLASYWVLGFWILTQVWHVFSLEKSDTAWWAHVGGLLAGAILVTIMRPAGVALFECMRPEDVIAVEQARAGAPAGTPAGPWSAPR